MDIEFNLDDELTPEENYDLPEVFGFALTPQLINLCDQMIEASKTADAELSVTKIEDYRRFVEELEAKSEGEERRKLRLSINVLTALVWRKCGLYDESIQELEDALMEADGYARDNEAYYPLVYAIEDLMSPK